MTNEMIPFQNGDFGIHAQMVEGEPWFLAADICRSLDLGNVGQAVSRLDDDEKGEIISNDVTGRPQSMLAVNEPGLYTLTLSSRKPEAKAFKRWITHDVLPALRKNGQYAIQPRSNLDMVELMVKALRDQEQRLQRIEAKQDAAERGNDYFTVLAYSRLINRPITPNQAITYGKMASNYCRKFNIPMGEANDPRYGSVHTYPESVLKIIFEQGK